MSYEFLAMALMIAVGIAIAFSCIAYVIDTIQNIYLKYQDRKYILLDGYAEGFKEGCRLYEEIAKRRAEKKNDQKVSN